MIRKKLLRLLLYDYQWTARCCTIYRTFKQLSSGDFTTICREKLRLLVTTIPAGTLRLLLTSISYRAKARKEMRWEPPMVPRRPPCHAAGLPRRVEGARIPPCPGLPLTLTLCRTSSRRAWKASRPCRADHVQVETLTRRHWHESTAGLTPCTLLYTLL